MINYWEEIFRGFPPFFASRVIVFYCEVMRSIASFEALLCRMVCLCDVRCFLFGTFLLIWYLFIDDIGL